MKKLLRLILIIFALGIGGLLGQFLLVGFDIIKMIGFGVACVILGNVLHIIDKKLSE